LKEGIDPYELVAAENLKRRHLTTGQRAIIASKMANLKHGSNRFEKKVDVRSRTSTANGAEVAVKQSAANMKVGKTSVYAVRRLEKTNPEKYELVKAGKVPLGNSGGSKMKSNGSKPNVKARVEVPPFKGLTRECARHRSGSGLHKPDVLQVRKYPQT
jgi:hypothetical protein